MPSMAFETNFMPTHWLTEKMKKREFQWEHVKGPALNKGEVGGISK